MRINGEQGVIIGFITMFAFCNVVLNFKLWMIPAMILIVFAANLLRKSPSKELVSQVREIEQTEYDDDDDDVSSDEEEDEAIQEEEQKFTGLFGAVKKYKAKIAQVRELGQKIQEQIGSVASTLERVDNLGKGTSPIMTIAAAIALMGISAVLLLVPLRFMILVLGLTMLLNSCKCFERADAFSKNIKIRAGVPECLFIPCLP